MSAHLTFDSAKDRDLEGRIRIFLSGSGHPCLGALAVEASNGNVNLRGRVCCFYERQLAINYCQRVAGVLNVDDQIEVDL